MNKPVILYLHGFYGRLISIKKYETYYKENGYDFHAIPLLGFDIAGKGSKGYIEDFNEYVLEIDSFIEEIKKEKHQHRYILIGENIGATIALLYGIKSNKDYVKGIIAVNPVLDFNFSYSTFEKIKYFFFQIISKDERVRPPFDINIYFKDTLKPEEINNESQLELKDISLRFLWALERAIVELKVGINEYKIPVYFQISRRTKLLDRANIYKYFESIKNPAKHYQDFDVPYFIPMARDKDLVFEKQIKFINEL